MRVVYNLHRAATNSVSAQAMVLPPLWIYLVKEGS